MCDRLVGLPVKGSLVEDAIREVIAKVTENACRYPELGLRDRVLGDGRCFSHVAIFHTLDSRLLGSPQYLCVQESKKFLRGKFLEERWVTAPGER